MARKETRKIEIPFNRIFIDTSLPENRKPKKKVVRR